jgi:hypothetical protein
MALKPRGIVSSPGPGAGTAIEDGVGVGDGMTEELPPYALASHNAVEEDVGDEV